MISAPESYKISMDKTGRNRSYIKVGIGIINVDAQAAMQLSAEEGAMTFFSDLAGLEDGSVVESSYSTLEYNRMQVDGRQIILPSSAPYKFQGFVSHALSGADNSFDLATPGASAPTLVATFGGVYNLYGITFNFDVQENDYPTDFEIEAYVEGEQVQVIQVSGNTKSVLEQITTISAFDELHFVFHKMNKPYRRVRIQSITLGVGRVFTNLELINTKLNQKISSISAELPTYDFEFEVDNTSGVYDLENESNVVYFLQERQPVEITYGYDINNDGKIYWINGGNYLLSGQPEIGETSVKFESHSTLDYLNGTYYKGIYSPEGITLYDLAENVLEDAKLTLPAGVELQWYIDSYLKTVKTTMPLPVATHAECLQLIANAGRAVFSVARDGRILLQTAFIPEVTVAVSNSIFYSHDTTLMSREQINKDYATLEPNFMSLSGNRFIVDREGPYDDVGYVSEEVSTSEGTLHGEELVVTLDATFSLFGFTIIFGEAYPSTINVVGYRDNAQAYTFSIKNNTSNTYIHNDFISNFNKLVITFDGLSIPGQRLRIRKFSLGKETDYTVWRRNTAGTTESTVLPIIRNLGVEVNNLLLSENTVEDTLYEEEYVINGTETIRVEYSDPSIGQVATLVGEGTIDSQYHFTYASFITVSTTSAQTITVTIKGKILTQVKSTITRTINATGSDDTISNQLVSNQAMALDLLEWILDYYLKRKIHTVPFRGDPILDLMDIVFYETRAGNTPLARITELELEVGQGMSGELTLKEITGLDDEEEVLARALGRT